MFFRREWAAALTPGLGQRGLSPGHEVAKEQNASASNTLKFDPGGGGENGSWGRSWPVLP